MADNSDATEKEKEDLKKAEEIEKELNKMAMSLQGLNLFALLEKFYFWSNDDYPEKGMWGHIGEFLNLCGIYADVQINSISPIKINKPEASNNGSIKDQITQKLISIIKIIVGILKQALTCAIKSVLIVLKTAYDSCMLLIKTIGSLISSIVSQCNAMIKTIGNVIALIKKLFVKYKDGKLQNPWITLSEMIEKWYRENIAPYYSWSKIKEILFNQVKSFIEALIAPIKSYIEMIKIIYDEIASYIDKLKNGDPIKEALNQFIKTFFDPILSMIEEILTLFLNSITNYNGKKELNENITFNFTSDTVKDEKGRFVYCESLIKPDSSITGKYSMVNKTVEFSRPVSTVNWAYGEDGVILSANIPGLLNNIKLKSSTEINGEYKPGTFLEFKKDVVFDIWTLIDEYLKFLQNQALYILQKLEVLLQNLFNKVSSTFLPHALSKVGTELSEFPSDLTGCVLFFPEINLNVSGGEMPTPKIAEISSSSLVKENSLMIVSYKCSWINSGRPVDGKFLKSGEKIKFYFPDDIVELNHLSTIAGNCILLTDLQYKLIEQLKDVLNLPKYAFNTLALAVFGTLYIASVQMKLIFEAANNVLKIIGLQFTPVIKQLDYTLNSKDDATFFEHIDDAFEWPKWEDFSGNPLKDISFKGIDFSPITNEFKDNK